MDKKTKPNFSKLFWTTSSCHVCWTLTTSLKEYLSFHFRQKEITAATCYQPLLYLNSFHDHPLWYQYNDAFPPHPQKRVKCFNYLGMSMSALPRAQLISFSFWLRNDWYNYNNHYMISWTKHAFWLNLINDLMEDRHVDDIIIKKHSALYHIKQADSMSPWVSAVTDHRRHQNLVKASVTY